MGQIINFPTSRERFRIRIDKLINENASLFDEKTRASIVKDMSDYLDVWETDDQFTVTYDLDQRDALSEVQLKAIKVAFEPHFERMNLKSGYLLSELLILRNHKAICEMLHGKHD